MRNAQLFMTNAISYNKFIGHCHNIIKWDWFAQHTGTQTIYFPDLSPSTILDLLSTCISTISTLSTIFHYPQQSAFVRP